MRALLCRWVCHYTDLIGGWEYYWNCQMLEYVHAKYSSFWTFTHKYNPKNKINKYIEYQKRVLNINQCSLASYWPSHEWHITFKIHTQYWCKTRATCFPQSLHDTNGHYQTLINTAWWHWVLKDRVSIKICNFSMKSYMWNWTSTCMFEQIK